MHPREIIGKVKKYEEKEASMIKMHQRNNSQLFSIEILALIHSCTLKAFLEHSSILLDLGKNKQRKARECEGKV